MQATKGRRQKAGNKEAGKGGSKERDQRKKKKWRTNQKHKGHARTGDQTQVWRWIQQKVKEELHSKRERGEKDKDRRWKAKQDTQGEAANIKQDLSATSGRQRKLTLQHLSPNLWFRHTDDTWVKIRTREQKWKPSRNTLKMCTITSRSRRKMSVETFCPFLDCAVHIEE